MKVTTRLKLKTSLFDSPEAANRAYLDISYILSAALGEYIEKRFSAFDRYNLEPDQEVTEQAVRAYVDEHCAGCPEDVRTYKTQQILRETKLALALHTAEVSEVVVMEEDES
jgi:hypothetical protein